MFKAKPHLLFAQLFKQELWLKSNGGKTCDPAFHLLEPLEQRLQSTVILFGALDNFVELSRVIDELEGDGLPLLVDHLEEGEEVGRWTVLVHGD